MSKEPPLHQAVIDNDASKVKALAQQPAEYLKLNDLGYSATELAHYLGRKDLYPILNQAAQHVITAQLPDAQHTKQLDEAAFRKEFGIGYAPYLHFSSYEEMKTVIHNCPWTIRHTFWGHEARELGFKYREHIASGFTKSLVIKWIDGVIGFGLFAEDIIEAGDYIGEYTGAVKAASSYTHDFNAYCFHYPTKFWSRNYYVIDAQQEGNAMRFINHSDEPNLTPQCVYDRGLLHLVFIANQPIYPDSQLTFNYGEDYWQRRVKIS